MAIQDVGSLNRILSAGNTKDWIKSAEIGAVKKEVMPNDISKELILSVLQEHGKPGGDSI
jgi:hypothetical protein